jgi:fatty-acyl-CoA synthase
MSENLLWPRYLEPGDLADIESVPLEQRGLPGTTYDVLVRAARTWPERPALAVLPDGQRWAHPVRRTFSQLLADVHRVANGLHDLGVRRGDAVALMSPNCDELITATLAAQLAGVAAPVNAGLSPEHVRELLALSGARVLVVAGPELDTTAWNSALRLAREDVVDALVVLRPTAAELPAPDLPAAGGPRVRYLADLRAGHDAAGFVGRPPSPTDLAALFHTGGTTGVPKLAAHRHVNEVTDAWMIAAIGLLDQESVCLAALPLFHVNAVVVTLLAPLLKGQQVVWAGPDGYRDAALLRDFWQIVAHHEIATMSAVPTVYGALAQRPVDADISSLRFAMVGASTLPSAVREAFQARSGVPLVEGYGLTEATCASARSFPDAPRPGSVGQRLPYQQVKAVRIREDGRWEDVAAGEVGVLAINGPTVFAGYVTGRDASGHVLDGLGKLHDGWLDTGDLGRVDPDGFVHLTGRAKDVIIRGGHNIDPAVIEEALLSHPKVAGAAAVGRPDAHSGEVPVAYVTLVPDGTVTEPELLAWAAERVSEATAAPKAVTVIDAIPVTHIGKPYKLALRAHAAQHVLAGALADLGDGITVTTAVEDGSVTAHLTVAPGVDPAAVKAVVDTFTIHWHLEALS